jgi:hypothetical protein
VDDIDPFVRAKAVCEALGGISRRCLYDRVQRGDFVRPDRPAQRRGEADLWRLSTLKRALEEFARGKADA